MCCVCGCVQALFTYTYGTFRNIYAVDPSHVAEVDFGHTRLWIHIWYSFGLDTDAAWWYNRSMVKYGWDPKELSVRRGSVVIEIKEFLVRSGQYVPLMRYFDYCFGNKGEWRIKWKKLRKAH